MAIRVSISTPKWSLSETRARLAAAGPSAIVVYFIAALAAMFPVVRMTLIVLDGSRLQHNDYWLMLPRFTDVDGALDIGGLFEFQNQPVVVPQIIYWLNMKLFAGSNISLGFVLVFLVLAQLTIVALLLWQSRLGTVDTVAILLVASALMFNLTGTWNFSKSMSGTAWFSANLFALLAILLRSRDRSYWAFVLAVLAAVSYGTGAAAWAAVIAAGVTRRPLKAAWREWPYLVGFIATLLWYRAAGGDGMGMTYSVSPGDLARQTVKLLGFVLGLDGAIGNAVGLTAFVAVSALIIALVSTASAAGWVGLATFGLVATLEVSFGRSVILQGFGVQNRYSSPPAFVWLGFVALLFVALQRFGPKFWRVGWTEGSVSTFRMVLALAVTAPLLLGALTAGVEHADEMLESNHPQELREIAMRLDVIDGTPYLMGHGGLMVTEVMRANAHYPFVDDWGLDCGLLGEELDRESALGAPSGGVLVSGERVSGRRAAGLPRAVRLNGYLTTERPARCVVIANEEGVVVGVASLRPPADADRSSTSATWFEAWAKRGEDLYRAYAVYGHADPLPLDGVITTGQLEPM